MVFVYFLLILRRKTHEASDELQQSIFKCCWAKKYCYTDGLHYYQNNYIKDSLNFLYLKSAIKEVSYFPQKCFNMLAKMAFYKSISKDWWYIWCNRWIIHEALDQNSWRSIRGKMHSTKTFILFLGAASK